MAEIGSKTVDVFSWFTNPQQSPSVPHRKKKSPFAVFSPIALNAGTKLGGRAEPFSSHPGPATDFGFTGDRQRPTWVGRSAESVPLHVASHRQDDGVRTAASRLPEWQPGTVFSNKFRRRGSEPCVHSIVGTHRTRNAAE